GELADVASLERLAWGCEIFFNIAGVNQMCVRDPSSMERANVAGVDNAVDACLRSGVRRLVHTSSAVTLGERRGTVGNEGSLHRGSFLSEYERTKYLGEQALFAHKGDLEVVSVNPSSVQGPGRATGTGRIILDVINGRLKYLVDTRISLVDIEDCATGHVLAALKGREGHRYVLSGPSVTVRSALETAGSIIGRKLDPTFLPGWLVTAAVQVIDPVARVLGNELPFCPEMVRVLRFGHSYDGSRAVGELGVSYRPIEETIERTVRWFDAEGLLETQ
ncbi:MAG: NAD-dependent epimerase/dehydratase family protein, partial [Acidimicrobiia bacterium]|nr:NAD-dependent epimerase/dehydratase family protein [Acidimicrobiia bacterium]